MLLMMTVALLVDTAHAWGSDDANADAEADRMRGGQLGALADDQGVDLSLDLSQKKISAINALLPVSSCESCRKVKYELYATNGCYQW